MKSIKLLMLALFASLVSACSKQEVQPHLNPEPPQAPTEVSVEPALASMERAVLANLDLLKEVNLRGASLTPQGELVRQSPEAWIALSSSLAPTARNLIQRLGYTPKDIEEFIGKPISATALSNEEATSIGIISLAIVKSCTGFSTTESLRGGNFAECLIEAVGIPLTIEKVYGYSSVAFETKAVMKMISKVVARIGVRTLSGIGLALAAAEFIYCMY